METSTSLFAPVKSDFDKLRVWFPTFHEIRIFGRNIHIPVPIFFPAFTPDFYLILRIEGLVQFRGSWLGFKVSTKWLNVLYFRKFKPRVTWLNTWFIVFRILSPSSRNRSCSGSVCNLKFNIMRKHIWFELINKLYLLFYKRLRFIRFKDISFSVTETNPNRIRLAIIINNRFFTDIYLLINENLLSLQDPELFTGRLAKLKFELLEGT